MKVDITFKGLPKESHEFTKEFLEQQMKRHLELPLSSFRPSRLQLHAVVEQMKQGYSVRLRLHVPPKMLLVAKAGGTQLPTAIQEALIELSSQAERHHARVSGREQWKRKARRQRLHALKTNRQGEHLEEASARPDQESVVLSSLLSKLENYVRHELTYLRNSGELLDDYPSMADIRDEAFLRLQSQPKELTGSPDQVYERLLKHAIIVIEEEIANTREHGHDLSLEDKAPSDAMDEAEAMVEEDVNEYFQPDEEELHIADLIPDVHIKTPEQDAEVQALDASYYLLSSFPSVWRRVVILVYREHLSPEDVAQNILGTEVSAVQNILAHAEAFIQAHLQARGLTPRGLENMLRQLEN